MKVLSAKNNQGVIQVELEELMVDDAQSVVQVAPSWAIFPRQYIMALDIQKNGLTHPIIVLQKNGKLLFAASGCRIQYAVLNGYTHVDALVCNTDEEVFGLMAQQRADDDAILFSYQGA